MFGKRGARHPGDDKYVLALVNPDKRVSRCGIVLKGEDQDLTVITEYERKQVEGELNVVTWTDRKTGVTDRRTLKKGKGTKGDTTSSRFYTVVDPNIDPNTLWQCGSDECAKIILPMDKEWFEPITSETITFFGIVDETETLTDEETGEETEGDTIYKCPYCGSTDVLTLKEADANYIVARTNRYNKLFMTEKERAKWEKSQK